MKRRTALQVMAGGVAAEQLGTTQHHLVTLAQAPATYKQRFFSPAENELLERLTEMIIPADDHSLGAGEAKVSLFIDLMVSHSAKAVQEEWSSGLKMVDAEARKRSGRSFLTCSPSEQDQILAAMATGEVEPATDLERFFTRLKSMTLDGYYTSVIGIHSELKYKGNVVLADFQGCRHSEH